MIKGELVERVARLVADRTPFAIATVVGSRRPTSVRPGDTAVVLADGTIEGFVGGACAESSVRLYSLRALETGEPVLLRLVPGDGETETDATLDGAVIEHNPCLSGGTLEIFIEPQLPAARVVIVGSSPTALAIERVATAAGYDAVRREVGDVRVSGGDAAVIVSSHGSGEEERVLAEALSAGVPYVALVASTRRGEAVRAELEVAEALRAQLHTPAGLAIGASTPDEIAISILAELVAELHSHPGRGGVAGAPAETAGGPVATPRTESAIDPVCGMEVAVTAATPSLVLDGERAFFCGEGCRAAYAKLHAGHGAAS
jgi:xanthine dehydrogenase accessory factor